MTPKQVAVELRKLADALDATSTPMIKAKTANKKIRVETPSQESEPWVDIIQLAQHIGFGHQATRKMVADGRIPGKAFVNGKKTFWRFRLSAVDAVLGTAVTA